MKVRKQTIEQLENWQIEALKFLEELRAHCKKGLTTNWKLKVWGQCLDLTKKAVEE
ncbi:hypothetical protein MASR1M12_42060 [Erysipelotrichia bacterium]